MVTQTDRWTAVTIAVAGLVVAAVAPEAVVLGGMRLAAQLLLALGAWLAIGRLGAIDLSVGVQAGAGALVAGIAASQAGVQALWFLPIAAVSGAVVGAVAGSIVGRVGRTAGSLATLALAAGLVSVGRAVPVTGGRSGFHAVPLLFGGDRGSLAAAAVVAAGIGLVVAAVARRPGAARAAVAVAAPPVSRSLGRRPELDVAVVGGLAGVVLGIGGLVLAAASGSVLSDGFGPEFLATLALAAVLAERLRRLLSSDVGSLAPVLVAVLFLHGPGIVLPLVPWIGTLSPLASTGAVAIVLLGLTSAVPAGRPASRRADQGVAAAPAMHPGPLAPLALEASGLAVPAGTVDLAVKPGEVVALVGPNGVGKSTVLARIGGQLPDAGGVRFGEVAAPTGAIARARAGVGRAWQRAVDVEPADLVEAAGGSAPGAAWADAVLGPVGDSRIRAALVALAARRAGLVLLDEPAAVLPADAVAAYVRGLADAGAAVLLVEHRPEVIAVADRIVRIEG